MEKKGYLIYQKNRGNRNVIPISGCQGSQSNTLRLF